MKLLQDLLSGRELEAILFDLDGTLIDSVPDLAAALDASLEQLNYVPAGVNRVRGWVGNGARKLVQRGLAFALEVPEKSLDPSLIDQLLAVFFEHYGEQTCEQTVLYPGVREALTHWHTQGIKMACVTNKPARFSEPILAHFGLQELMPVLVGGDTLAVRKPDPAPLLLACEQLGVAVANTVMVGDSVNDVAAARAANMPVACVSYGYNHGASVADAKPDILVDRFIDLSPGLASSL
ncbi:phosphoglycolate phosphatase [Zhongshania guokunii]|uniref:Phosphoglycolate phosphatase n=1 Tax=Zhongshania guokunii TaxID=641783 RepID=A0ABV3U2J4_9GAMM